MIEVEEIRVICQDGGRHDQRGTRNIILMRRLSAPGLDGRLWREVPVTSGKKHTKADDGVKVFGSERRTRETVFTPQGERLTGASAGRTRSAGAATGAGHDPEALTGSTLHFDLKCSTCGLGVSVSGERMDSIMEKVRGIGESQVSLSFIQRAVHLPG